MGQTVIVEASVKHTLAIAFKNEHLSVSRLKLYEQCPRAFYYRYIDKGPTELRDVASLFGTILHAALELVYMWIRDEEYEGPFPLDQLVEFYKSAWATAECKAGVNVYQEGLDILRTYAKTHFTVSHWNVIDVEREFNITVDGFTINGYIDRVDRVDDKTIDVVDYKSNRLLFTRDELEHDLQMSIYGLACRELYPWAENVGFSFHMLRHDTHQKAHRSLRVIDDAAGYVGALGRMTEDDVVFEATPNPNCCYCDHRRRCEKYQELIEGKHEIARAENLEDWPSLVNERYERAKLAKAAYARRDELDKLIRARLAREGDFDAGNFRCRTTSGGFSVTYEDANAVAKTFRDFAGVPEETTLHRIVRVDKDEVEKMRVELAPTIDRVKSFELTATLEAIAKREPNTPRLDVREIKTAATAEKVAKKATPKTTKRGKKSEGSGES